METLEAYIQHHGNLSQTAEALFIHRNTLQYRMDRIAEIASIDLDNPETWLALQLAIKANRLLSARVEENVHPAETPFPEFPPICP